MQFARSGDMKPTHKLAGLGISIHMGWGLVCLGLLTLAEAQTKAPRLEVHPREAKSSAVILNSSYQSNTVFTLEASTNLTGWQTIGVFHDALFAYPDLGASGLTQRFYRLTAAQRRSNDDWKNQLKIPAGTFGSTNNLADTSWVKFAILLGDPVRVYYEDSNKYPFHYDFATRRLASFAGMDPATFEQISLHRAHQQVVLGSVLYPPWAGYLPAWMGSVVYCGIQFDGIDPYTPDEIARWFALVKATVHSTNELAFSYMPSFEQSKPAEAAAEALADRGVPLSSVDRWSSVNACYSSGWALGRLKYFAASDIVAAFADGRLRPDDILLTDGVPANTPIVAGILSLTPSTPNSHTAILSQSMGIPFGYLATAAERTNAQALVGRRIILRTATARGLVQVKVVDVEGSFTPAFEVELLAFRAGDPIEFTPKQAYGAIWASADGLGPADIRCFGGKAANYGMLRRYVPTNCPIAIAFSFDLWDAFLDQTLPSGKALRVEIGNRLAAYGTYPPDIVSLKTNLAAIRDLFTTTASFTPAQQAAITNSLAIFNPRRNIRFRSSTNIEDTERFTGAGLYDSFSGCLIDDLDGDDAGPCQCEAGTGKEHGVFRALRRVYASFYNDDAYLARLIHRVDETKAGMGVLVHHSFPDEAELANGVATPRFDFSTGSLTGDMVTQLGAVSVTNPDGASVPEVVGASDAISYRGLHLKQGSSLVPLGGFVMDYPADYQGLLAWFTRVAEGFRLLYPAKRSLSLDFEYKKDAQLGLVVKQVRPLAQPAASSPVTAFLIDEPVVWEVMQYGSVFANHALKSLWRLHSPNLRLTATNLIHGVHAQSELEYLENGSLQTLSGLMSSWPNATNSANGSTNYWTTGSGASQRAWRLETTLQTTVSGTQPPVFTLADFRMSFTVNYATPVPVLYAETLTNVSSQTVRLQRRDDDFSASVFQTRTFVNTNGVTIETTYYWPKPSEDGFALFTPLQRFIQTRISGLTTHPIVLRNYYSQTYGAYAHNSMEEFLFEPRLEPGLPPATRAELDAANIQLFYVTGRGAHGSLFFVIGFDQTLRRL